VTGLSTTSSDESGMHGVQVRLVDDDGRELDTTDGQMMGEIHALGPNVFLEYLSRPDAAAEAFHEGWFAAGDLATRSADGYLHIVRRRALDLIESGGYKIGAGEIEDVLREHPAVEDVAVTGKPDDDLGERVVEWVVRRPGKEVSSGELVRYVARMLDHKSARAPSASSTTCRTTPSARCRRTAYPDGGRGIPISA
jgi:malonyl-CoA/methylmalonyl-CoA synthetase